VFKNAMTIRSTRWLWLAIIGGVVARAGIRIASGEEDFLTNGYTFYLTLANSFLAGDGFCYAAGQSCAIRMPVYPLFLAGFSRVGFLYPGVVIAQSIMGTAIAWMAWRIGTEVFTPRVGLLAAVATALNPYSLVHDTALQETVLLNLCVACSLVLLLSARRTSSGALWFAAGLALALAILTSARVVLFVPLVIVWALAVGGATSRDRSRAAIVLALPIVLLVGAWTMRNWRTVGSPVLTTEAGESLYFGNSPLTFTHFPTESVDLTAGELERLPPEMYQALERLEGQDVARDNLFRQMALDYIAAHPGSVAWGGLRKLWVVASAEFSPARGPAVQWAYRIVYLPLHVLALVGLWCARKNWRVHAPMWGLAISFAITTAVFWAHTSHTSYLDPILFVYAAAGLLHLAGRA
jgi:hypothetical protein